MRRSKLIWLSLLCAFICALLWALAQRQLRSRKVIFLNNCFSIPAPTLNCWRTTCSAQGIRPPEWTNNTDLKSPTVVSDLWFDNELLANAIFGPDMRPPEWIGASVPNNEIIARNVRHDLELSADDFFGRGQRPQEWRGAAADPDMRAARCKTC